MTSRTLQNGGYEITQNGFFGLLCQPSTPENLTVRFSPASISKNSAYYNSASISMNSSDSTNVSSWVDATAPNPKVYPLRFAMTMSSLLCKAYLGSSTRRKLNRSKEWRPSVGFPCRSREAGSAQVHHRENQGGWKRHRRWAHSNAQRDVFPARLWDGLGSPFQSRNILALSYLCYTQWPNAFWAQHETFHDFKHSLWHMVPKLHLV